MFIEKEKNGRQAEKLVNCTLSENDADRAVVLIGDNQVIQSVLVQIFSDNRLKLLPT